MSKLPVLTAFLIHRPAIAVMVETGKAWLAENRAEPPEFDVKKTDVLVMLNSNGQADVYNHHLVKTAESKGFIVSPRQVALAIWATLYAPQMDRMLQADPDFRRLAHAACRPAASEPA